jgi:hypothetical protein
LGDNGIGKATYPESHHAMTYESFRSRRPKAVPTVASAPAPNMSQFKANRSNRSGCSTVAAPKSPPPLARANNTTAKFNMYINQSLNRSEAERKDPGAQGCHPC